MDAHMQASLVQPIYPFDHNAYNHSYVTPTHTPSSSDSGSPPRSTYSPSAMSTTTTSTTPAHHGQVFPSAPSDSLTPAQDPYLPQMGMVGASFTTSMPELVSSSSSKTTVEDFDADGAPPSLAASFNGPYGQLTRPLTHREESLLAHLDRLKFFLATAPSRGNAGTVMGATAQIPAGHPTSTAPALNRFALPNHEYVSCVLWEGLYYITGTDIVRALVFRFEAFGRPVRNMKKFEEGVFSDLRNLKPGVDACLEEPKSPFLDLLFKYQCIRTQKKQKVFYWFSVPHDRLFLDALDRDLKRERAGGQEPTSVVAGEPALSFAYDPKRSLYEQFLPSARAGEGELEVALREGSEDEHRSPFAHMFSLFEGSPNYKTRGKPKRRVPNALTLIPHGQSGLESDMTIKVEPSALGLQMGGFDAPPEAFSMSVPTQWAMEQHVQPEIAHGQQQQPLSEVQGLPSPPTMSISPAHNSVTNHMESVVTPHGAPFAGARPALERRHNSYPVSTASGPVIGPYAPTHAATLPAFVPGSGAPPTSAELAAQAQLQASSTLGITQRVRGFVCPLYTCGRTFKRMEHLKRHVRTHTLERPFACQTCEKRFARSDNLTQHLRTHARENGEKQTTPSAQQQQQQQERASESDSENQAEVPLSSGYATYVPPFQVSPLGMNSELGYGEEYTTPLGSVDAQGMVGSFEEGQEVYYPTDNMTNIPFNAVVTSPAPTTHSLNSGTWLSASPQPGLPSLDSDAAAATSLSASPYGHFRHLSADSGSLSAPSHRASFDAAGLVPPASRSGTASPGSAVRRYRSTTPSFPRGTGVHPGAQRRPSDYELAVPRGFHPYAMAYSASESAHSSPSMSTAQLEFGAQSPLPQTVCTMPRTLAHARSSSSLRGDVGSMLTFPDASGNLQAYAAPYNGNGAPIGANELMFASPAMLQNQTLPYSSPQANAQTMGVHDATFYTLSVPETNL